MIELVLCFFSASVVLYAILGGADYGAGIIELFSLGAKRSAARHTISHALAPVWEANHVWLILALVILFNAFPAVFHALSVSFHIPLTLMLVGIVFRGCAFTFRQYDASGAKSEGWYSLVFQIGSLVSPLMQGMIAGAVLLGHYTPDSGTFVERFVEPWLNPFGVTVGIFTCALDALLAAVFLISETDNPKLREYFIDCARYASLAVFCLTPCVFIAAEQTELPLFHYFWNDPLCLLIVALASCVLLLLQRVVLSPEPMASRFTVSLFMVLVLFGFCRVHFPHFPAPHGARSMASWAASAAPPATLHFLLVALIAGMFIVLPAMYFLLRTFKLRPRTSQHSSAHDDL